MLRFVLAAVLGTICMADVMQPTYAVEVALDPGLEAAGVSGFPVNPPGGVVLPPGWVGFKSNAGNVVGTTSVNPRSGTFAGELVATASASNAVLKNANVGIGIAAPFVEVEISFWARGRTVDGGVTFAEFFSELDGEGVSKTEILGGQPLPLDPNPDVWKQFTFQTTTGPDVGGGVTLQFAAIAGGAGTSAAEMYVDDISIDVAATAVPAIALPYGMWLFGSLLVAGATWVHRRRR
jgi:hypothetical protein